jgi:hypothetical protein
MTAIAPDIENLSLNITEEIHVRSSLTATFAALLAEMVHQTKDNTARPCR